MTSSIDSSSDPHDPAGPESVEMPRATAWPIVLALGITLLGAGLATSLALSVVGAVLFVFGLGGWIGQLLPGRGHRARTAGRAGAPSPARRREAGHGGPAPPRHGGLSVPASREGSPDLRRRQGRHRGRPGDAHPGAGLRPDQRPWPLVPHQPAGGDGRSGDQRRDRGPARAILSWGRWSWRSSFTPRSR